MGIRSLRYFKIYYTLSAGPFQGKDYIVEANQYNRRFGKGLKPLFKPSVILIISYMNVCNFKPPTPKPPSEMFWSPNKNETRSPICLEIFSAKIINFSIPPPPVSVVSHYRIVCAGSRASKSAQHHRHSYHGDSRVRRVLGTEPSLLSARSVRLQRRPDVLLVDHYVRFPQRLHQPLRVRFEAGGGEKEGERLAAHWAEGAGEGWTGDTGNYADNRTTGRASRQRIERSR